MTGSKITWISIIRITHLGVLNDRCKYDNRFKNTDSHNGNLWNVFSRFCHFGYTNSYSLFICNDNDLFDISKHRNKKVV